MGDKTRNRYCSISLERIPENPLGRGHAVNIEELKNMSRTERIRTMEALWDSLIEDESEIESPDWHRDVLEDRKRKIESGEAAFISLDKLRASRKS